MHATQCKKAVKRNVFAWQLAMDYSAKSGRGECATPLAIESLAYKYRIRRGSKIQNNPVDL